MGEKASPLITDKEKNKGLRIRRFFELEAHTLLEKFKTIETLLPHQKTRGAIHRGEEGRHIESLLRSFLNHHLPGNLRAVTGFILCPSTKTGISDLTRVQTFEDRHSRQLDIIVYDFDAFPVYERFEEFCIVPPEGVIGIISVKKRIYLADVDTELDNLREGAEICASADRRGPFTGLFAFSSEKRRKGHLLERVFEKIRKTYEDGRFDTMINEFSILGDAMLFKIRSTHSTANQAEYKLVSCDAQKHIPLQRLINSLMSVYYDSSRSQRERPGFVSFEKETFKRSPSAGTIRYSHL